tara:strand:+ start:7413 stop:8669 length:1257 start_codon:yes stop_codon:yes gene_type:complete
MRFFRNFTILALMGISALVINSRAYAYGDYGLSCNSVAYGTGVSSNYIQATTGQTDSVGAYGVYTGLDCAYAGAGRSNSSAIVGGEIARLAANAVVGAVTGRLSTAMNMNSDTAAHMSYTTNGNGIGMAANHIVGGLSLWTNVTSSNFENDQTFTSVRFDSNNFDGNSTAVTVGADKRLGNVVIGLAYTAFDSDIDTTVNRGNIKTEGETMGLYLGLNTGAFSFSAGAGQGEYEIDTRRQDLGSGLNITASDITADVTYYHLGLSGSLNRGKLSFMPRVNYRNFDLDLPAFTDLVPNDGNSFSVETDTTNDSVAGKTYSSDMTEAGLSIALATSGKITPFVDVAYVNEETTSAAYQEEATADGTSDLGASAPDGYITYGGGVLLNLSNKVNGYVNISETTNRDDYSETTISGSLKLKF